MSGLLLPGEVACDTLEPSEPLSSEQELGVWGGRGGPAGVQQELGTVTV